jgi:hypothetical protein
MYASRCEEANHDCNEAGISWKRLIFNNDSLSNTLPLSLQLDSHVEWLDRSRRCGESITNFILYPFGPSIAVQNFTLAEAAM